MSKGSLVALPPIHIASFSKWNPERKDEIFLYSGAKDQSTVDRDKYRYKLTVVDHPSFTSINASSVPRNTIKGRGRRTMSTASDGGPKSSVSFSYTNATFIIPAGRESEYMFSSFSGLRSIVRSANSARLIAVAIGRNYDDSTLQSSMLPPSIPENGTTSTLNGNEVDPLQIVQDELRYVIQAIASAIPTETVEAMLNMKPNASLTYFPFLSVHGVGQRNIIDTGDTTCSGRYIIEQCAISEEAASNTNPFDPAEQMQKWVRRLYFLDGNPYVIQSEVALLQHDPTKTTTDDNNQLIVDKSVTSFEYHKSLTVGLLALLTPRSKDMAHDLSCTGLVIGLGGGCLINFWHYLLGEPLMDSPIFQSSWNVTAVELDEAMVCIAARHFGLNVNHPGFSVKIGDGLDIHCLNCDESITTASVESNEPVSDKVVITSTDDVVLHEEVQCAGQSSVVSSKDKRRANLGFPGGHFDFIVIDVDSKVIGSGMSCPPVAFVNQTYLQSLFALLQPNGGILAINVAARDKQLFYDTCQTVQTVFGTVFLSKQHPGRDSSICGVAEISLDEDDEEPEDLNVVVFGIRTAKQEVLPLTEMRDRVTRWLQRKSTNSSETDAELQSELCECLQSFIVFDSNEAEDGAIPDSKPKKKKTGSSKGRNNRRKKQ